VTTVDTPPRARLTAGLAEAIAEKGYAAATIADVVRHARVSKRTFYEHFADKEACFLALYSDSSDEMVALIAEAAWGDGAAGTGAAWEARAEAAARTYFSRLAAEPALTRAALLEVQAAGPRALKLRREVQGRYARLLIELSARAAAEEDGLRPLSPTMATAVVGALNELMLEAVEADRTAALPELAGAAVELLGALLRRG
jgi:AcrR family transcriptional regulator